MKKKITQDSIDLMDKNFIKESMRTKTKVAKIKSDDSDNTITLDLTHADNKEIVLNSEPKILAKLSDQTEKNEMSNKLLALGNLLVESALDPQRLKDAKLGDVASLLRVAMENANLLAGQSTMNIKVGVRDYTSVTNQVLNNVIKKEIKEVK